MNKPVNEQIEALNIDFVFYSEIETEKAEQLALTAKDHADNLTLMRDTLISIAMNQSGLASHSAQDALRKVGLCYHFMQDYFYDTHDEDHTGYSCTECHKFSKGKMEPFA